MTHEPQVSDFVQTLRPARALIGWMTPGEAQLSFAGRRQGLPVNPEQVQRADAARAAVAARAAGAPASVVTDCPASLAEYSTAWKAQASAAPFVAEGWTVGMVDLRTVCSAQPTVHLDTAKERVEGVTAGDLEAIAKVTLPMTPAVGFPAQYDDGRKTWVFSSANPNLRIAGHFSVPSQQPGTHAFGFFVTISPSFVQVARYHGRSLLRDGYHRSVGLLARGIFLVPALVRDFATFEELTLPAGMLSQNAYLGDRPPLLSDYMDDAVAASVDSPTINKTVVVQGLEFATLG